MAWIDVWNNRPFQRVELTAAIESIDYVPRPLGALGDSLFPTSSVRTRMVAVQKRTNRYALIPTSPIGAPPVELEKKPGDVRPFETHRIAKGSTVYAEEMQGMLWAPETDMVRTLQEEIAERGRMIREDHDLTHENMRLGAVMGRVIDADGTTVLDDWFANWGEPQPAAIDMELDDTNTSVRAKCTQVIRAMRRAGKGGFVDGQTEVHALIGPGAFDLLVSHEDVIRTYLNWPDAAMLRGAQPNTFQWGGITWHEVQPADDTVTMTVVGDDEIRFFPVAGRDVFQRILAPAEFDPWVNSPGQEIYAITIPDRDRQAWVRVECYCYPLYVCLRPAMLIRGYGTQAP